ncbi:MAG: YihY/virulence factor BrkB family protein [bacterium]
MSLTETLDRFQQRHTWAGFPLAVIYKYADDQGAFLAALITYYGFLSLFPLLLLVVTILGFALDGNPHLKQHFIDSALNQFPGVGQQLGKVTSLQGNTLALVVGVLGSLYGALGVAQAGQNALNRVWAVPRHRRPNPFMSRMRSLLFLLVIGAGLLLTTGVSILATFAESLGAHLDVLLRAPMLVLAVAVNVGLFMVAMRVLTAKDVSWSDVLPGAALSGVAWQLLQELGKYYVAHQINGSTTTYGIFAVVLGLLAYIYLAAVIVVLSAEVNVVRAEKLWPRSLLTAFTDDAELTPADRKAYRSYPESERHKEFEQVDVRFEQDATD